MSAGDVQAQGFWRRWSRWFTEDTDHTWRELARQDPYFAVLTTEEARDAAADPAKREAFFRTGEHCVAIMFGAWPEFQTLARDRVIDFGCGVGRLLIPLARNFRHAVGIDVSEVMLAETASNAAHAGVGNIELFTAVTEAPEADLVHSQIVLQHIPVETGLRLIAEMWAKVRVGGFLAIQFPIAADLSWASRAYKALLGRAPWLRPVFNLARGKPHDADRMQMNVYPLNRIVRLLHAGGANRIAVHNWPSDPWHPGVYLIVQRLQPPPP